MGQAVRDRTIVRAGAVVVERPTSNRLATSYGEAPEVRPHVILEIEAASGAVGLGEASPLPEFTGETAQSILTVLNETYLHALHGRDAIEIDLIVDNLNRLRPGNSSAKAAIDLALHDLAGKLTGQPVYRLLGGPRRREVRLARAIGIVPISTAVDLAQQYVAAGFRTLKLKVGGDPQEDVARVRATREAVGPEVALRIDANQGYDVPTAVWVLRRLEDCGLLYAEQPLPARDLEGLRRLRRQVATRLMADEGVHSLEDALQLAADRLVDVFAIKFIKTGGLVQARKIAAIAEAAGIACVVISTFDTQIGGAAGLHLAVSLPLAPYAHELTVFVTQPHLATTSITLEGDKLRPGDAPGLGVEGIAETRTVAP